MVKIRELSKDERPREKLFKKGASFLTIPELLAVILRTGTKEQDVLELSKNILSDFGSLKNLFSASKEELLKIKGLNIAKIATLLSVIELAKRYQKEDMDKKVVIRSAKNVYEFYSGEFFQMGNREHFLSLYLNSKNVVIREERLGSSMSNACLVHPQEFIRGLIKYGASRLILIHNHPSNDNNPSENDIKFTKDLSSNLKYFGFELLDHIIFTQDGYLSMREEGIISD